MLIPIRKWFIFLTVLVVILLCLHFTPQEFSWTLHTKFYLDAEANVPTWYSTVLLFLVAVFSGAVYTLRRRIYQNTDRWKLFWLAFGLFYSFLSLDEAAQIHEVIDRATSIKWIYFYAPMAAIFFAICFVYFWFIRSKDGHLRRWVLGGLVVYAIGGLLSESISFFYSPLPDVLQTIEFVFEEGFEMLGTIIVLMGCSREFNALTAQLLPSDVISA